MLHLTLGLIAAFIASKIVTGAARASFSTSFLALSARLSAVLSLPRLGGHGVAGFNLYSMFVGIIGASWCSSYTTPFFVDVSTEQRAS